MQTILVTGAVAQAIDRRRPNGDQPGSTTNPVRPHARMSSTFPSVTKLPRHPAHRDAVPPSATTMPVDAVADAALAGEPEAVPLSALGVGDFATIHAVRATDDEADRDLVMRLIEIGFVPGERVRVIAIGRPGNEPIAVRLAAADGGRRNLNGATFAMRRHEADFIRVVPDVGSKAPT